MAGRSTGPLPNMQAPKHKACHDEWNEDCKIFVGGLGEEGTRIELDDAFGKFGPIKNIWLAKAPPSFAYIEMEDPRDAEDAVKSLHRDLRHAGHRQDGQGEGGGAGRRQGQDAAGGD